MAFTLQNWARESVSALEPVTTLTSGTVVGCFRRYNYYSPTDNQATCSGSGYFNSVSYDIATGDLVTVYSLSENSYVTYQLTNTSGTITAIALNTGTSYARVVLPNAQLLGMYATPVQLVPAPGSGLLILLDKFVLNAVFVTDAFANGGVIAPQYDSTTHGGGTNAATTTIAASYFTGLAANSIIGLTGVVAATATSGIINKGLYLSNATGAFTNATTGASTAIADVWYKVVAAS